MHRDLIGTEHVLLGLIHEGGGLAATALQSIGISLQAAREQAREDGARVANRSSRSPKFSPLALQVIDRARQEAAQLEQNFVGTEHLLLSLLRDEDGVAARVLEHLGKDLSEIRDAVLNLVTVGPERDAESHRSHEAPETPEDDDSEHHQHLLRRALPILAVAAVLGGGTVVARRRGFLIGRNLIVRCRQGHLFTTIWLPGASLKSIRLGWARIQRCPVGKHWSIVTPVREADLSDEERQGARKLKDIRIP
jgi:hypothetical protein